jgi:hypothetical protein
MDSVTQICSMDGCENLSGSSDIKKYELHGSRNSSEYKIWCNIKQRCYNSNSTRYKDYGGRSIVMSDAWHDSFIAFYKDMGKRPSNKHSIERKDNDKGYTPENCIWATDKEQSTNKRTNVWITYADLTMTISQWAQYRGINHSTLRMRLHRNKWSIGKILGYY